MNMQIIAMIIQEGGKLVSYLIKNQPIKTKLTVVEQQAENGFETRAEKAINIEAGCIPCSIGHLGTCTGLLNEAMRFAKKDGIQTREVIDRVNICIDELNALERVDLRSELIANLSNWEKELANRALNISRKTRHSLESFASVNDLEQVTADTQTARQDIGRQWFKQRLARMSPEEKEKLTQKAMEKLEEV